MAMLQQMSVQQHVPAAAASAVDAGIGFLMQVAGKRAVQNAAAEARMLLC
jgi:hypothetical protein